ncbi:MAG: Ig-like domain-containing protein [Oligoflexia bacterium]|nr:Ig-like domain-containing protein [Oligoflexia bacterium]
MAAAAAAVVSPDIQAPTVAVLSPAGGASVKGIVNVEVSAVDDRDVAKVELLVNGSILATDAAAPFAFSWDTTPLSDGSATLTARAFDGAGNSASSAVTVQVANAASAPDTIAPVVRITSPAAGTGIGTSVTIQGQATDNIGVAGIELFIDGIRKATVAGATISYKWSSRKAAAGTHLIRLDARDAAGNIGTQTIQVIK